MYLDTDEAESRCCAPWIRLILKGQTCSGGSPRAGAAFSPSHVGPASPGGHGLNILRLILLLHHLPWQKTYHYIEIPQDPAAALLQTQGFEK